MTVAPAYRKETMMGKKCVGVWEMVSTFHVECSPHGAGLVSAEVVCVMVDIFFHFVIPPSFADELLFFWISALGCW